MWNRPRRGLSWRQLFLSRNHRSASDTTPRVKRKKQAATPDTSALVIAGVDESSASHLAGSSAKEIHDGGCEVSQLLETVHDEPAGG